MRRVGSAERVLAATFVGFAVISFLVPIWSRGTDVVGLTQRERVGASSPLTEAAYISSNRFSVVPVILLGSAFAVLAAAWRPSQRTHRNPWALAFVAHVLLVVLIGFRVTNIRSFSPGWDVAVERAELHCSGRVNGEEKTRIVQEPGHLSWFPVIVACRDVR